MNTISLFSGAGGLDIGAVNAGATIRGCIENDHDSVQTLKLNHGDGYAVLEEDIAKLSSKNVLAAAGLQRKNVDLIIGGPPCQSFSKNSYWTKEGTEALRRRTRASKKAIIGGGRANYLASLELPKKKERVDVADDMRTPLIFEFARLVREIKPRGFVFENVSSLLHPKNKIFLDKFMSQVSAAGYSTRQYVLSSEEYGIAQKRKRIFVTGIKSSDAPDIPKQTHSADVTLSLKPIVPVKKVIEKYRFVRFHEPEEVITGRWAQYLPDIPPGMNYKALTRWAGYKNPIFEAETKFWNFLLKLHPDKASWTIPANPGPWIGPLHWKNRRLRIPERAAIQDFPDGYKFYGNRRSVIRQIGNAAPPKLAEVVIKTVVDKLNGQA